ncbi:transposase [Bdellovibrio sp. HCB209]|uniref:transposase n=1 Tax=Bdellovibrio sp. HCB209 TaxID=3394354 RepID=UPI0039B628C0
MPRKPLIYTHENPYHVFARSNNQEWFYLPKPEVWFIFKECLNEASERFGFQVYLFVLMDNHYHMIAQCSPQHNLGEVMGWLQKTVSKNINHRANKINHVFGGVYKACLLQHPDHFATAYKYVALNPVAAGISSNVFTYPFLSLNNQKFRLRR